MLDHLSTLFFGYFVDMAQEGKQRVEIEKLQNAFTVLVYALKYHLVDLSITLAKITRLVSALIHRLDDRVQIFLSLHLQDIARVVFHSFFLFVNRLEKIGNLLNAGLIFILDRFNHS